MQVLQFEVRNMVGAQEREVRTVSLKNPEDLVSSNKSHLGNSVRITEGDTDLGWGKALTREFGDMLDDFFRGRLEPCWWSSAVGEGRGGYFGEARWSDGVS